MSVYDDFRAMANEMIPEFGASATLIRAASGDGEYDPATGLVTPVDPTQYPLSVFRDEYKASDVDGSRVKSGDFMLYVAPTSGTPVIVSGDKIVYLGVSALVVNNEIIGGDGSVVMQVLQVRRA